jgi:hypothetical protein
MRHREGHSTLAHKQRLFPNAAAALQFNLMIYCKELHFLPGRLIILI